MREEEGLRQRSNNSKQKRGICSEASTTEFHLPPFFLHHRQLEAKPWEVSRVFLRARHPGIMVHVHGFMEQKVLKVFVARYSVLSLPPGQFS